MFRHVCENAPRARPRIAEVRFRVSIRSASVHVAGGYSLDPGVVTGRQRLAFVGSLRYPRAHSTIVLWPQPAPTTATTSVTTPGAMLDYVIL